MKHGTENSIANKDSLFQKFLFKLFFLVIYLLALIKINYGELNLFFDGNVFRSIYENYNIDWKIFDTKYQFLQGLGSPEFIFNLNLSLSFLTSYFINKLSNFDLVFLYHFFSYLLLFGTSYLLFSKVSKEKNFYLFLIYFSFFFSSVSLINYNLKFSNIFSNVPHFIELSAYINLCIFFLIKSFNFNHRLFNFKNFIFFIITFFYITCFANIYLLFYSIIFFFLILLITIISFKKKIVNIKYFLILNLLLFLICFPNIIISFGNMLNSNAYFFSEEMFVDRKINFVSYFYQNSLVCKVIYLLFLINLSLNFKTFFKKNIIINIVSIIIIAQALFFSVLYLINPNLLKLSPIYSEYIFLTIIALQSFLILEKINNKRKYIILFVTISCISLYSNLFMKFPDYLKINTFKNNDIISKLTKELDNKKFSGKFVTYNNTKSSEGHIKWSENVHNDIFNVYSKFKNDFRILSSHNFQIPSLNLYSTNITPTTFNYYKLLSSAKVKNERSSAVFDKINFKILEMLGVRFIIEGKPIKNKSINFISKINEGSEEIYLYEIDKFKAYKNPINIIYSKEIEEINNIILSEKFDSNFDVVIHDKKSEILNTKFSKLDNFTFNLENNYINTKGIAKNKVLVVLPYQFSSCFISKNKNLIFPANGGLLGIIYDKNLNDEIYYKQNSVNNFNCVLKDFLFFRKIYTKNL